MDSALELEGGGGCRTVEEEKEKEKAGEHIYTRINKDNEDSDDKKNKNKIKRRWRRRTAYKYLAKIRCLRVEEDKEGNLDMEVEAEVVDESTGQRPRPPTHLLVMVNGIIGSAQNWKYAAKQLLKTYPRDVIVHCSKANTSTLTFDGVDVMGERLAEEVVSVIKRHPSLQKISFVAHSLGGLVSRYAIAKLYGRDLTNELFQGIGDCKTDGSQDKCAEEKFKGKIAGLEPINFITFATPHLGSRWHKQVPLFGGSYKTEKVAASISWFLGRTGKHLFLTDGEDGKPPLLLQMVSDSEDLKFVSALQSFKRRVAYANVGFDHLVGWSTSSLRRRNELPKRKHLFRDEKYSHIVHVETSKIASSPQEVPADTKTDVSERVDMEEEMIRGLTKMSWERIDVNFSGSIQRFMSHNTIQVKNYFIHFDGADVVQHMVDNFLV